MSDTEWTADDWRSFANRYARHLTSSGYAALTCQTYIRHIHRWIDSGFIVDPNAYLATFPQAGLGPGSVNQAISSLRSFFQFLNSAGYRNDNPWNQVRATGPTYRSTAPRIISEEATAGRGKKLDLPSIRDLAIAALANEAGLRTSELRLLNLDDVNLAQQSITVRSTSLTPRIAELSVETVELLQQYLLDRHPSGGKERPLFTGSKARPPSRRLSVKAIYRACLRATRGLPPRDLRWNFARRSQVDGMLDQAELQYALGYSSRCAADEARRRIRKYFNTQTK